MSIPHRPFGTTGETVSLLGLGGHHIGAKPPEDEAIRIVHEAIDSGVTFLDNAWEYNDNESERRMGIALAQDGYRQKAFLMSKNFFVLKRYNNADKYALAVGLLAFVVVAALAGVADLDAGHDVQQQPAQPGGAAPARCGGASSPNAHIRSRL